MSAEKGVLKIENEKLRTQNAEANAKIRELQAGMVKAQDDAKTLSSEKSSLERQLKDMRTAEAEAIACVKYLTEEKSALEKNVSDLQSQNAALKKQVSKARMSSANAKAALETRVTELKHQRLEFLEQAHNVQASEASMDHLISDLQRKINDLEVRNHELLAEMEGEMHKSANLNCTPILKQKAKIKKLEREVQRYRKIADSQRVTVLRLTGENTKLKDSIAKKSHNSLTKSKKNVADVRTNFDADSDTSECSLSSDSSDDSQNGEYPVLFTRSLFILNAMYSDSCLFHMCLNHETGRSQILTRKDSARKPC